MKIPLPSVVVLAALFACGSTSGQAAFGKPRHAVLQGRVVDTTGAPLGGYNIVAGERVRKSNVFSGGPSAITDERGRFRIKVESGKYLLSLHELRAMTLDVERREAALGRLVSQRTAWKEVASKKTTFRMGNMTEVDVKAGQVRTFVFRFRPLRSEVRQSTLRRFDARRARR